MKMSRPYALVVTCALLSSWVAAAQDAPTEFNPATPLPQLEQQMASCHAKNVKEANQSNDVEKLFQPGFRFFIKPDTGPESITGVVTEAGGRLGLAFCSAEQSQLNNLTPHPGNCNTVISPPFLTVPADEFLKEANAFKSGITAVFKFILGASIGGAQFFTSGLYGGMFQSLNQIFNPDPVGMYLEKSRLHEDVVSVIKHRKKSCDRGDGLIIGAYVTIRSNHVTGQSAFLILKQTLEDKIAEIHQREKHKEPDEPGGYWHDARVRNIVWTTQCYRDPDSVTKAMELNADPATWMYMDPLRGNFNCAQPTNVPANPLIPGNPLGTPLVPTPSSAPGTTAATPVGAPPQP